MAQKQPASSLLNNGRLECISLPWAIGRSIHGGPSPASSPCKSTPEGEGRERRVLPGSLHFSKMMNLAWGTEKVQNSSDLQFLGVVSGALSAV